MKPATLTPADATGDFASSDPRSSPFYNHAAADYIAAIDSAIQRERVKP